MEFIIFIIIVVMVVKKKEANNRGTHAYKRRDMNDNDLMEQMQRQQHQQFMDWSMEESMKSVTPFEHGGYDMGQGNSFNDHHMGGF